MAIRAHRRCNRPMLSLDPLAEETAFLAAAVNEGSLSARDLMLLVTARAELPVEDRKRLLGRADDIDAALARGARLRLPGVPFITVGRQADADATAFEREGAIRLGDRHHSPVDFRHAADAVSRGIAAFALATGFPPDVLAGCQTHALVPAGRRNAILARSCRDLAVVMDA